MAKQFKNFKKSNVVELSSISIFPNFLEWWNVKRVAGIYQQNEILNFRDQVQKR